MEEKPEKDEFGEDFFNKLEEISKRVDEWPEWKKRGWAFLDLPQKEEPFRHPNF